METVMKSNKWKRAALFITALFASTANLAFAQTWTPQKNVELVVYSAPGGSNDTVSYTHLTLPTNREV